MEKYGKYEQGYPQVLTGLVLKGFIADSFWRGTRLQRRRGEEKKAPETRQHRQDKPTQAKGSLQGQMTFSESGWRLAEAININLGDPVRVQISLGPHYICPRMEFPR